MPKRERERFTFKNIKNCRIYGCDRTLNSGSANSSDNLIVLSLILQNDHWQKANNNQRTILLTCNTFPITKYIYTISITKYFEDI